MSEPQVASTKKPVAAGNSSRTIVIVVVVALIVIAVAGIVLAGRSARDAAPEAPSPAPLASAPAVAAAPVVAPASSQVVSAPAPATSDEVVFLAGSDKLPSGATEKIADVVQRAKAGGKTVRVTVRYLTGANKTRDLELAKARATALRHAVMADGVTGDKMQIELVEMPEGSLKPADAQRAVFSLR